MSKQYLNDTITWISCISMTRFYTRYKFEFVKVKSCQFDTIRVEIRVEEEKSCLTYTNLININLDLFKHNFSTL